MSISNNCSVIIIALALAGCTTIANPGPNAEVLECQPGEQSICSGATASRLGKSKDPHSTCRCEPRVDHQR